MSSLNKKEIFEKIYPINVKYYEQYKNVLIPLINTERTSVNNGIRQLIIQFCDKFLSGCENILLIIGNNHSFSAIDIASINRSIFEAAVNLLYRKILTQGFYGIILHQLMLI